MPSPPSPEPTPQCVERLWGQRLFSIVSFNQEKALVGAFSVIVQQVVEPMDRFTALVFNFCLNCRPECSAKLVQGSASAVSCVGAAGAGGEMLMSPFSRRGGSASCRWVGRWALGRTPCTLALLFSGTAMAIYGHFRICPNI